MIQSRLTIVLLLLLAISCSRKSKLSQAERNIEFEGNYEKYKILKDWILDNHLNVYGLSVEEYTLVNNDTTFEINAQDYSTLKYLSRPIDLLKELNISSISKLTLEGDTIVYFNFNEKRSCYILRYENSYIETGTIGCKLIAPNWVLCLSDCYSF